MLGRANEARRYGKIYLADSEGADIAPFALACTYEALARAEAGGKSEAKKLEYVAKVEEILPTITGADTQKMIRDDLATIPWSALKR
ncbi:hypothetical protein ACFLSG_01265 [Candidatus Bipolaricaulota bacterium]